MIKLIDLRNRMNWFKHVDFHERYDRVVENQLDPMDLILKNEMK